jgi:hypothetical protein
MSIVQSRRNILKSGGSWQCVCDMCGRETEKAGLEAGDAALVARKEGWKTYGGSARYPFKWMCRACSQKQESKTKNSVSNTAQ